MRNYYLKHADPHVRFEAFKLANSYLFGVNSIGCTQPEAINLR